MAFSIIIRRHEGVQSYLVLDDNPRELLRHIGFTEEYSVRPWLGSEDPLDALEEWSEMLQQDLQDFLITDTEHRDYVLERSQWDHCEMWPKRKR